MTKQKQLRFAVLCRVSTERQADERKVSLANQEKQIGAAVEALGGTTTKEYKGNQHATPGYEQAMVERLLEDAQRKRKPFDAVIVAEPTRWSRDNLSSKQGLQVFRDNGIRFFAGTTEYDLFDPTARLVLGQMAEIGEYFARIQKQKAVQAKVAYARQGRPSTGSLPFGRTWDREGQVWGVDQAKKRQARDAAERYLAGESIKALATEYGMDRTSLHDILRNRCGPTFIQRFDVPDLGISETVEIEVPALLDAKTVKAVQRRMDRQHSGGGTGNNRHAYLLGGHVRCIVCGKCLSPQINNGARYYRRAATCTHIDGMVRADDLEKVVASQLVGLMGNPAAVAAANKAHQVALGNVGEQWAKVERLDTELTKVAKAQERTVGLLARDLVDEAMVMERLAKLRGRQHKLEEQRENLAQQLAQVPTQEAVEQAANRAKRRLQLARRLGGNAKAATLPRADLEALIAEAFGNTTHPNGNWPGGVFIKNLPEWKGRRPRRWAYELYGNLPYKGYDGPECGHTDTPPEAFEADGGPLASDCVNGGGRQKTSPSPHRFQQFDSRFTSACPTAWRVR